MNCNNKFYFTYIKEFIIDLVFISFRAFIARPLYNRIRSLKRQLDTANKKLMSASKVPKLTHSSSSESSSSNASSTAGDDSVHDSEAAATPIKEAQHFMRNSELSPTKYPDVCKSLVALNVLSKQVRDAPKDVRKAVLQSPPTSSGKKTGCTTVLAQKLKISRKSLVGKTDGRQERKNAYTDMCMKIKEFLDKPENSCELPTKRDAGRRSLNDTLKNLHAKFRKENPGILISFSSFAKKKPHGYKSIKYTTRRQCLCIKHLNGKLKMDAIREPGDPTTVEDFLALTENEVEERILAKEGDQITFQEWKLTDIKTKNGFIKRTRLLSLVVDKDDFMFLCTYVFRNLRDHIMRMKCQFQQVDALKRNLGEDQVVTQMDYSENFECRYQDEPSALYYDCHQITLHPMVVYFTEDGMLKHQSFIGITDEMSHAAPTTYAFMKKLVPAIKNLKPGIRKINVVTDSPVSQYRNKSVVKIIASSQKELGVEMGWDFLEAGHGKGPCDGVGGSIKQSADIAIKRGTHISNAKQFYDWAREAKPSLKFIYLDGRDIACTRSQLSSSRPAQGLSWCHTIQVYQGYVYIKETSCHEGCCVTRPVCDGWKRTEIKKAPSRDPHDNEDGSDGGEEEESEEEYVIIQRNEEDEEDDHVDGSDTDVEDEEAVSSGPVASEPPVAVSSDPVASEPPVAVSNDPVASEPPVAVSSDPVASEPPVAVSSGPVASEPPVAVSSDPVASEPPVAISSDPVASEPPVAVSSGPVASEPPVAVSSDPVASEPPVAVSSDPVASEPPVAVSGDPVASELPVAISSEPPEVLFNDLVAASSDPASSKPPEVLFSDLAAVSSEPPEVLFSDLAAVSSEPPEVLFSDPVAVSSELPNILFSDPVAISSELPVAIASDPPEAGSSDLVLVSSKPPVAVSSDPVAISSEPPIAVTDHPVVTDQGSRVPGVGTFVAAKYGSKWYVGKVIKTDLQQLDPVHITFMTWSRGKLKWSLRDEMWLPLRDILCSVNPPIKTPKGALFEISQEDSAKAEMRFKSN